MQDDDYKVKYKKMQRHFVVFNNHVMSVMDKI